MRGGKRRGRQLGRERPRMSRVVEVASREFGAYMDSRMPVSAVNDAAAIGGGDGSGEMVDVADEPWFEPTGWLRMMQACGAFDVRLKKLGVASRSDAATTTVVTAENGDATTEEATSRKCEEQLSLPSVTNSYLSCKPANHTTEMAQEDQGPSWDNLPTVILQEIFSYLSHETRLKASQVCKNWRGILFHPRFWKKITFIFRDEDSVSWARFLGDRFALSVHEATIRYSTPAYIDSMGEACLLLIKLSHNTHLKKLFLEISSSTYGYRIDSKYSMLLKKYLINIIKTSNCLEALSLGYTEELVPNIFTILEPLRLHHAKHLTHLSLASIKAEPKYGNYFEFNNSVFNSFISLSLLTLDYEFVNDTLLKALDNGCMQRFVIHVTNWKREYPGTTNKAWQAFVQKNPQCELRLNLIHSYDGVRVLDTGILCPAMPLTHLKVLFCKKVNISALLQLSMWYSDTLRSLTWIDSIDRRQLIPATFDPNDPNSPDPLVLMAWKCTKLKRMVFLGYKYYQENLLAIARLRGSTLKLLVFAKSDIISEPGSYKDESIAHEIRDIMGLHWMPLNDTNLPTVILNSYKGSSKNVIVPLVLSDQK